jgi:hypothetical protein
MTSEVRLPQLLNCDQWILDSLPPIYACACGSASASRDQQADSRSSSQQGKDRGRCKCNDQESTSRQAAPSHQSCRPCFSIVLSPGTAGSDGCNSDQWIIRIPRTASWTKSKCSIIRFDTFALYSLQLVVLLRAARCCWL